ncbi:MAG TPA: DNA mismatch repair endonuclease MutL, partial [Bryobacteraceae bacterium]|nr:DNA mismatch repair endonuclease MutL [Bryobacteraceae bacterium]
LLENSLDAGATEIRVDAEKGGRRMLRIVDNGCGMMHDDALLAFERHATSKLRDTSDLLAIATLGFRGEALPSIASVSRLLLETRTQEEETGTLVEIAGGKLLRCEESALAPGTTITVRDLFYNVPARRKFLRSEQTEIAHIASLLTHYSLAHPDKAFTLNHDGSELLSVSPCRELRERVYQVFGAQVLEDLIDIGFRERTMFLQGTPDDPEPEEKVFAVRGFISKPQVQKLNRNSIYLFVNGRLIRDRLLMHALSAAYHNLMPPACYPFALLFLELDCEEVDVNVHPSKTEVRFRHQSFVHDFVRDTLREVLMMAKPVSSVPASLSPQPVASLPYSEFSQTMENGRFADLASAAPPAMTFGPAPAVTFENSEAAPEVNLRFTEPPVPRLDLGGEPIRVSSAAPLRSRVPDTHGPLPQGVYEPAESMQVLADLRPLGQLHESFIVAAGRDGLWIIDQHVAHERILFERVLKQRAASAVERQQLLMPIVMELSAGQQLQYARIAEELETTGFETEPFGNRTIAIKAAPAAVSHGEIEKLVGEILEIAEGEFRHVSLDDLRRGIVASIACRAAIKINTRLDFAKMEYLLTALAATEYPMACPHGRPIALRYAMRDILRAFHRI